MRTALIALVVVVAAIIGYMFWSEMNTRLEPALPKEEEQKQVTVTSKTIQEDTDTYTINAQYPQLGIASIDTQVESTIKKVIDEFKGFGVKEPLVTSAKNEFTSTYDPPYIAEDIVSVRLTTSMYTGGAHSLATVGGLNFNRKTGELLQLSDALALINMQLSDVAAEALRQMRQKHGDALFQEGLTATPEHYNTFVIDGTKVTFIFQLYQVVAYAAGFQEVAFPRKK